MDKREKVIQALENCTAEIKCRDCPWDECEGQHEHVELPKGLALKTLELLKAQEVPGTNAEKWISVKDRMPDQSGKYLIVAVEQGRIRHVTTAMFGTYFYMTGKMTRWRVTHWMPLPELPKEMKRE